MSASILESFCVYLYKKRWLLVINFLIACTAAAVYAFVIMDREYSATVTFLPPSGDNISAMSLLNLSMPSLSSGGASADQIEILFNSNAIKRRIVDEFNLIEFFKLEDSPNQFGLASRFMGKYVMMRTGEKGGMGMSRTISYAISCYHRSPDTAKLMADFTFAIIDSAVREISISRAQRNREFIEAQIVIQNEKMDSLQAVFQEFQHTNKAFNIPEQTRLTLKAYADLQAAAVMNELRLAALRREFTGQTHEIAELRRLQRVYQEKLGEYESGENPAVIPSLELSSRLFPEYAKMMRDIEVQNQLTLFLTKELEQARLQEARDVSPLIIVDPPFIPEYKARPKRLLIILVIVFAQNLLILGLLAHTFALKTAHRSGKFDSFLKSIKQD